MEFIPIPYFGMIMFFFVAPVLTFGFIGYTKKIKADVEKKKYEKEILELEIKKEEIHLKMIEEENKKYDKMLGSNMENEESRKT
jgi:cell shape-determining protein MreC